MAAAIAGSMERPTNLGAKGVAECATVAVIPAIINAAADSIGTHPQTCP